MPELTVVHQEHMDDWWTIERAEHDGREWLENIGPNAMALRCSSRISDADVEGYSTEMHALADAIEARGSESFKRCAVEVKGDVVEFSSPRNSRRSGSCSLEEADRLVTKIRATVPRSTDDHQT